jgi:ABC-type antimicrobial peptide transport system permease subunit
MAYSVVQRQREIGIRLALGAQKANIIALVLGRGLKLTLLGVAVGLGLSLALTRIIRNLLYGVEPTDPLTFLIGSLVLLAVALLACWLPGHRAANVDPMVALRAE